MNKLYSKIAALSVSLAMAVGVGVAVGSKGKAFVAEAKSYSVAYTLDCSTASADGSEEAYGANKTSVMAADGIKAFLNAAAGSTLIESVSSVSGYVYWAKGSGGDGIPDDCLKIGKASAAGSFKMTLASTAKSISKVGIVGYGWKTGTKVAVNGSATQSPAAAASLVTFNYELASETKEITINVTTSAMCVTSILLYEETSAVPPTSIACDAQTISVASSVNLANCVTFNPVTTTERNVSFSVGSGSEQLIDLTEAGLVTGKKAGNASVTITPSDTTGGATAINVAITITALDPSGLTVGNQYSIYGIDSGHSSQGELSGIADNYGTVESFTGDVPPCNTVFTVVNGYYENTVAFQNGDNYLNVISDGATINYSDSVAPSSSWIVVWNSTTEASTVTNSLYQNRNLRFNDNSGSPRFGAYAKSGDQQFDVCLHPYSNKELTDFTISSEISVYKSGSTAVEVTYVPGDASDKTLAWASANTSVATVDANGLVTGVAVGTTTVTASKTINAVLVERTCTVHVLNNQSAHRGTEADPFNVNDAVNVAKGILTEDPDGTAINLENEYYVKGLITTATTRTKTNLTLVIGDNEEQTSTALGGFTIFKAGKVYGTELGTKYSSDDAVKADFAVGYYVKAKGTLVFYSETTPETTQGSADIVWCNRIEATTYAGTFLTGDCAATRTNWSSLATSFAALSAEAKALYASVEHKSPDKYTDEITVEHAAARYDVVLEAYGTSQYTDFMGRVASGALNLSSQFELSNGNNVGMIVIIAASTASLIGFGLLLILKKRKVQK